MFPGHRSHLLLLRGLVLVLLTLATAAQASSPPEEGDGRNLLCWLSSSRSDGCPRVRLGLLGGTLLTPQGSVLAGGYDGSLSGALSRRAELGLRLAGLVSPTRDFDLLGSGELMLRLKQRIASGQKLILALSAGVAVAPKLVSRSETRYAISPSATVGAFYELSFFDGFVGIYVGGGATVVRPYSWNLLPHASGGILF
jgi:hypothetical protein